MIGTTSTARLRESAWNWFHWRTHTRPATGKRPQALVNQQAFDACDLVIAIFWSRFGTPTGRAASGTAEEIHRGIRQNKPVLVYFSNRPAPGRKPVEYSRMEKFKRSFGQKALFWSYNDVTAFETALRNHLAHTMQELLKQRTSTRSMKANTENVVYSTGAGAVVVQGESVQVHLNRRRAPKMEYPAGSIGADLLRRNYIRYLVERYFHFREADASFGPKAVRPFSYAVIFKNIETRFKAPTYFIPIVRFDELVDYLHARIEATILGKKNRARGYRNYDTFDEFQLTQAGG